MPDREYFSEEDLTLIHALYRDIHESESLDDFLPRFIHKAGQAAGSEYYGLMLFPSSLTDRLLIVSNNPPEYEEAYREYLGGIDALYGHMMESPAMVHCYSRDYLEDQGVRTFHNEGLRIRPNGDFFYTALGHQRKVAGFIGQVKAPGKHQVYTDKEISLHRMLLPVLDTALHILREKEKLVLLAGKDRDTTDQAGLFVYPDGHTESAEGSDLELLNLLFGATLPTADTHPGLASLIEELDLALVYGILHVSREWNQGSLRLTATATRAGGRDSLQNLVLVRFEKAREIYRFDLFSECYFLTEREGEVLRLVAEGCPNNTIAGQLKISEQTVKRHIYNIFEKTGCESRAQLIFLLVQS